MSISLVTIRDGAQQLSDKVGDLSVTTNTWNDWINQGVQSLWSLVANAFADHFFKTFDFTLVGNAGGNILDVTTIPDGDFRRVRFLEVYPGTQQRQRIKGFNFDEKDIGSGGAIISQLWCQFRRYRLMGSKLYVEPYEQAGAPYRLYYLPKPTKLAEALASPTPDVLSAVDGTLNNWFFPGAAFDATYLGAIMTVSGCANAINNGTFTVTQVIDPTDIKTTGPTASEAFGLAATVTFQPANSQPTMDPNVEEWWEYVICFAALKGLGKEETDPGQVGQDFQRVKAEIVASAPSRDQGQSDRIADVEDGDEGVGWGWG